MQYDTLFETATTYYVHNLTNLRMQHSTLGYR